MSNSKTAKKKKAKPPKKHLLICCPHCGSPLTDPWLRREGARAMGRVGGRTKSRSSAKMRAAANVRWKAYRKAA